MLAFIGGSGLDRMPGLVVRERVQCTTPFGEPSAPITRGELAGRMRLFLPRHGERHGIPPHQINYRANIWALREQGVSRAVGVAAVGGISAGMAPGTVVIPDQIIDYTHGREHTLFDGRFRPVEHIEFTEPYCADLRQALLDAARMAGVAVVAGGCYGAVQGPRLETRAEIARLARDGVDIVGMTGMPEAALAREADMCYACCALVANWAAGVCDEPVSMSEIERQLRLGMGRVMDLLARLP